MLFVIGGGFARLGLGQRIGGRHSKTSQDIGHQPARSSCGLFDAVLHSILVHGLMVKLCWLCLPQAMMEEFTSSSSSSLENFEARTKLSASEELNKFQNIVIDVFHVSPCRNAGGNARIQSYTVIHTRTRTHSRSYIDQTSDLLGIESRGFRFWV